MIRARRAGEVRLVARIAGSRSRRVVVVRVALRTGNSCVSAGQRIVGIGCVVEVDVCPIGSVMAGLASSRKSGGDVIRVGCTFPICLVAAIARCRQGRVVVIRMALRTWNRSMGSRQREYRGVIEA